MARPYAQIDLTAQIVLDVSARRGSEWTLPLLLTLDDVPLDMNSGVEKHMPSDQPGLLMRRMLLDLFARHGETEQTRHYTPRRAAE